MGFNCCGRGPFEVCSSDELDELDDGLELDEELEDDEELLEELDDELELDELELDHFLCHGWCLRPASRSLMMLAAKNCFSKRGASIATL